MASFDMTELRHDVRIKRLLFDGLISLALAVTAFVLLPSFYWGVAMLFLTASVVIDHLRGQPRDMALWRRPGDQTGEGSLLFDRFSGFRSQTLYYRLHYVSLSCRLAAMALITIFVIRYWL